MTWASTRSHYKCSFVNNVYFPLDIARLCKDEGESKINTIMYNNIL